MGISTIAIIGFGPRGLTIFDRIIEAYRGRDCGCEIDIHLIDPGEAGQGVHCHNQSKHLLMNTISGMVTMFPYEPLQGAPPRRPGPSLPEWARSSGYRRFGSEYRVAGSEEGEEVSDLDHLPRWLLGEYLSWYYAQIAVPSGIRVIRHRQRAIDVHPLASGSFSVELENESRFEADFLFIATGHSTLRPNHEERQFETFVRACADRNGRLLYIRNPYPTAKLSSISSSATVAVQGFGLTAHDVISQLTVGRGGEFVQTGKVVRYRKSGREPRLLVFSRNCLPFSGRGVHQKKGRFYEAQFFTKAAVASKRAEAIASRGDGKLDFDADLMPLLLKEMAYVYRSTETGMWSDPKTYEPSQRELDIIRAMMDPLRGRTFSNLDDYRKFFMNYLRRDLDEAEKGNVGSAQKAAEEVIRDSRQTFRFAVEYGGLTPESHRRFVEHHVPVMNRVGYGPPRERNYEHQALFDAGLLDLASGPGPVVRTDSDLAQFVIESRFEGGCSSRAADVLIAARLDLIRPGEDDSPLMRNILERGLGRPYYNGFFHPGGLDIDKQSHPIRRNGEALRNAWVVGYPVEGPHYYTYALPLPGHFSRHIADADKCVLELFDLLSARFPAARRAQYPAQHTHFPAAEEAS